jgi:DnaJ family protein A protein 5
MQYFSNSCYSGFDSRKEDNFYRVYGELFRQLDKEEELEELQGEEHDWLPDLGDADSTPEQVFRFYQHWQHFSTKKKFSYADKYNPNTAPNRRVKRLIDTENKKERQAERKEFNDTVVKLLEYVQKRDPRYQKFKLAETREKEAKRQREEEERARKRAEDQEKLRKYREEVAARYAQEEQEALDSGNFEEVTVEEYPCLACKKVFKNEKQMQNHLQSKKHKENYARFRETVTLDEETEALLQEEERIKKEQEEQEQQRIRDEKLLELENQKKKKTRKAAKEQEEDDREDDGKEL